MEPIHKLAGNPLAGLQEIPLPPAVPYVPQTLGWVIVAALLLLVCAYVAWLIVRHRRANAYRREALVELESIESAVLGSASSAPTLPALLKRTALAATSRTNVASLTGDDWLRFLDRSLGGNEFQNGPGQLLPRIAYGTSAPTDIPQDQLQSLIALSRRWIKHHHADV